MDIHDLDSISDLDAREAFALAQGREDIVDEIARERRDLQQRKEEEEFHRGAERGARVSPSPEYEALREDMAELGKTIGGYQSTSISHLLEQSRQIDKLWTDNAALRDELHAVSNRVEGLVRAVIADPADVAAKIVNEANRATLREVKSDD